MMTLSPLQRDLVEMGAALLAAVAVAAIAHRALTLVAGRLEASGSSVAGDSARLMRQPVAPLIMLPGIYMAAARCLFAIAGEPGGRGKDRSSEQCRES